LVFSSYAFIFIFLPVVFVGYFFLTRIKCNYIAKLWLVVASLIFYAMGSPAFFPFFMGSVFGNYILGIILSSVNAEKPAGEASPYNQKKLTLAIGIIINILLLGYYKYSDFFISNINLILS
jgi:D-alanyl-lipoteichoic acid acyltransferase DltB (MBOAT superfamily)